MQQWAQLQRRVFRLKFFRGVQQMGDRDEIRPARHLMPELGELPPGDHGVAVFAANDSILWKLGQLMGGQPVWWAARRPRGLGRGNAFIAGPSCWFAGLIIRLGRTTPPLRCSGEGRCRAAYLPPVSGEGQLVMVLSTLSNCCCISSEASVKSLAHLAVSAGVLLYTEYPTSTMTDPLRQTSV